MKSRHISADHQASVGRPMRALPLAAVAAVAVVTVAACGSAASPSSGAKAANSKNSSSHTTSVTQALALAASSAQKVNSFTAAMNITTTGTYGSHLTGTVAEQVRPTLLASEKFSVATNGTAIPGGIQTLLTSHAVFVRISTLTRLLGKPWVKISFGSLKSSAGVNLAPLIHQLQGNDPLAEAQMLPAATNVHKVGTATINGVPTTEYSGTLNVSAAASRLDPSLKKLMGPGLSAMGITTSKFTVWIDSNHLIRKLVQTETGSTASVNSTMLVTSVNPALHFTVPPASQVASMPGL